MLFKSQERISCDVLVIGSGGAGLRSAIAARLSDADVILVSKSRIGYSTNTYISKSVIAATGWGIAEDDQNVHVADTVKAGRFLNDQLMVVKVAEKAGSEVAFLRECGVRFGMEDGRLRILKTPGHSYPRHVHGENWVGSDLVFPLKRRAKQLGVRFVEKVFVTRLLASDGRITGATGVTAEARFLTIQANAVVLATGGYAQIFLNTNNAPGITGDGQALAYQLGISLKDMEFVQFYPTAIGTRGSRILLYERILGQKGVALKNGDGEDIIRSRGIPDPMSMTRDQLAQIIMQEIKGGRSVKQGVILDLESLSGETAEQLKELLPPQWWKGHKTFGVAPTAHFCMGGIVTDQRGETSLSGLFGAGEITAGVHGANRLGGNALAEIFAMGSLVGEEAAKRAMEHGATVSSHDQTEDEISRLEGIISGQRLGPKHLIKELKELMWHKAGVIRQGNELEEALRRIRGPWPRPTIESPTDLIRLLEFHNMRLVAEMVCRASLERTESRGSHFRVDHPDEDDGHWLKNIMLRKGDSGMELETRPVSLDLIKPEQ